MADSPLRRFRKLSAVDSSLPERVIRLVADAVLRTDDCVIDGGAFMGLHTKHFLHTCRDGRVVAYEANPEFAERLTHQFARYDHVEVRDVALHGDTAVDSVTFQVDDTHPSRSAIHRDPADSGPIHTVTVDAVTLDADLTALQVDPGTVALVKLDVEGAEFATLEGAQNLLTDGRPLVVLEHGADASRIGGYEVSELNTLVRDCGYEIWAFDGEALDGFTTDYWYFWLVPTEAGDRFRPPITTNFRRVLEEQESTARLDVWRRRWTQWGVDAKQAAAQRLPTGLKRRLRRIVPRL